MASFEQPGPYKVDRLPAVTEQIRTYFERAKQMNSGLQVLNALESIVRKLETAPLDWGDPQYRTKQGGGLVLQGVLFPFVVQYVAFEQQRVICILKIAVFPR